MLQKMDKDRLDKVLQILKNSGIRFPIAETVRRTGYKKGHVSNILSGKIPMSNNFYDTFIKKFETPPSALTEITAKLVAAYELIIELQKQIEEKKAPDITDTPKNVTSPLKRVKPK